MKPSACALPRQGGEGMLRRCFKPNPEIVDFLMEDIQGASDEQIGQAVREIHKKAQAAPEATRSH